MLSRILCCGHMGIDGYIVEVETDIRNGLPAFDIVGLGDAAVKESKERVRSAIKNSEFEFPIRRITVNLAPAHIRKEGSAFDLPVAIGILASTGQINKESVKDTVFVGELSLDGRLRPVSGVLPVALAALKEGISSMILPAENAKEAAVVKGINVYPALNIQEIVSHLWGDKPIKPLKVDIENILSGNSSFALDFADVRGQESVKRAVEIAVSGGHNCLLVGSPGCGKTMIAKRIPGIMPSLVFEEAVEITKIYSIAGLMPKNQPLITERPFRSPHHSITGVSLIGGGRIPRPGEISLAHNGVLFMDELPEFEHNVIEALRQPLEDGNVTVSRLNASFKFPARTMVIATANPCNCGNLLNPNKNCSCTPRKIQNYNARFSGPLIDRIDLQLHVPDLSFNQINKLETGEPSEKIRKRVEECRKIQSERFKQEDIYCNSQMRPKMLRKYCVLNRESGNILESAFQKLGLSARAHDRILKVSRTIADMEASDNIKPEHIAEAINYRMLDREAFYE